MRLELFASSQAKFDRGVEHLQALYAEMDAWGDLNPIHVGRTMNFDGSEHFIHVTFDPPGSFDRWAIMLGDATHNLRAALDHAVFALARSLVDPPIKPRDLQFPICSTSELFIKNRTHIKQLSETMQARIEMLQPYNRRRPNGFAALEWLAFLNDVDKHRLLHVMAVGSRPTMIDRFEIGADPGSFKVLLAKGPTMEGAPFLKIVLTKPDPDVHVDFHMTTSVVVDGKPAWGNTGVQQLMGHVQSEVRLIIQALIRTT